MKPGRIVLVVIAAAYVGTVALYAGTGLGRPGKITEARPAADGTTITIDLEELRPVKGELLANVNVSPGADLLDPVTHNLKEDFSVAVTSTATPTKRTWTKGMVPGAFPVVLTVTGDPSDYPFDGYRSAPVAVEMFRSTTQAPQRATVGFSDHMPGWKVDITAAGDPAVPAPYEVSAQRSPSTAAFAAVILGALVAIAGAALFVAVQTSKGLRKFQPPMTTWYAAMLFAVVPLRNALPDSPPIGFWIDVTVVLWVIVALVGAMLLYVSCWWKHTKPEPEPVQPEPEPTRPAA